MIPMLDLLVTPTADGRAGGASFTAQDAQWLLNSGLFRALIVLYTTTDTTTIEATPIEIQTDDAAREEARLALLRSIEALSFQSLSVLGKYAFRVPELARIVHAQEFQMNHPEHALLWSLMGVELAGKSRMRLRDVPVTTEKSCKAVVLKSIEQLVSRVEVSVGLIGKARSSDQPSRSKLLDGLEPVSDIARLAALLSTIPSVAALWRKAIDVATLQALLTSLLLSIDGLPVGRVEANKSGITDDNSNGNSSDRDTDTDKPLKGEKPNTTDSDNDKEIGNTPKVKDDNGKSDGKDKATSRLKNPTTLHDDEVSSIRKAIKILSLSTREDAVSDGGPMSAKTD